MVIISKTKFFLAWKNVWPLHDLHDCLKLSSLSILIYISNKKFSRVFNDGQVKSDFLFVITFVWPDNDLQDPWRLQGVKTENSDMYIKIGVFNGDHLKLMMSYCEKLVCFHPDLHDPWHLQEAKKLKLRKYTEINIRLQGYRLQKL